ncbi:MAG: DUF1232 domain-containing protein [Leptospiraceae bacterium]|nr:DUF1232 domain-containing protein [Leptospiraceae bacterium]MCK6381584.1 DUF1232 domain-containing protein [Leptospiraceae bacterium]NUM40727.1 DUF1232 domain-containing protein [Leptospiraceae bacterium]
MEKEINSKPQIEGNKENKKSSRWKKIVAIVILVIAILYDVSPIDFIPDIVPGFGWADDIIVTILAFTNLFRQMRK